MVKYENLPKTFHFFNDDFRLSIPSQTFISWFSMHATKFVG